MAALEPYCFEPNMLQTPQMMTVTIVKSVIAWKNAFSWPSEGYMYKVSFRLFSLQPTFGLEEIMAQKHGLAAKYS